MKKRSDPPDSGYGIGDLLGLGSQSVRKNYYPALQERIDELEQERNRYKWLFENALHGIFQANLKGGILACNPAMARICGYASPELLKSAIIRLREQLFCSASEFDTIRQELLDQGSLSGRETRFQRADRTPVHVAVTLLRRPDLGPEVVEAFVADITERVQARQRLEQLNAQLEQRVEDRTEALQNANVDLRYQIEEREKIERELVVAVAAAEDANRSKDKYLAAASHDLLQPL
ncbi:MAG: hybrid sensor histidine kinase/response regulator, partial [Marinobacter sp. 34-60-7]